MSYTNSVYNNEQQNYGNFFFISRLFYFLICSTGRSITTWTELFHQSSWHAIWTRDLIWKWQWNVRKTRYNLMFCCHFFARFGVLEWASRDNSPNKFNILEPFNPFVSNAPFLYTQKTLVNLTVFWCFQEVEKGCIGNKWVNLKGTQKSLIAFIRGYLKLCQFHLEKWRFDFNNLWQKRKRRICNANCTIEIIMKQILISNRHISIVSAMS